MSSRGPASKAEAFRFTKVVHEPDFFPLFFLRHLAETSKLMRRRSGFLRTTPAGRQMLDTPAQNALQGRWCINPAEIKQYQCLSQNARFVNTYKF